MSGGSYNYLCYDRGLVPRIETIKEMRDRLFDLAPYSQAYQDTQNLYRMIEMVQERANRLSDVWRAVEWADSSDITIEDARKEIRKYD